MSSNNNESANPEQAGSNGSAGVEAKKPWQISWQGWWDISKRVVNNVNQHDISLIAAGVALFIMLSVFPALNVAVSLYALFASPENIISHIEPLQQLLPEEAFSLITEQMSELANAGGISFNLTLFFSLLVWFWVSRKGAMALIKACNIIYQEHEKRPFWSLLLISLLFTVVGIVGLLVLALLAILLPIVLDHVFLGETIETLLRALRWPILALLFIAVLEAVYRFAPNRKNAKWRWVSVGAIVATVLWLSASIGFTLYVQNFSNYNDTYGAIGSVIILILWFYISAFVVLLGAEINAEMEHQTTLDSTVGDDKPMGERGAYVADTTPEKETKS